MKSPGPKQDNMTGHDGDVSAPAPLLPGTGPIRGFSAWRGGAGSSNGGKSVKRGKALAPLPRKSLKGREAEAEGAKKKRSKAMLDASGMHMLCGTCGKSFKSLKAVHGHQRIHTTSLKQQAEAKEVASILLDLGQRKLNTKEGSEMKSDGHVASGMSMLCGTCGKRYKSLKAVHGHQRIHTTSLKQQAEAKEVASILLDLGQRKLNMTKGNEMKSDGSAMAEGGNSSSAAEAQRKKIHMELDLNKEPPEEDDNQGA